MQEVKRQNSNTQHATDLRKRGATGIRTPDFLHAMQRQDLHRSMYAQLASLMRAHESAPMSTGCGTPQLYGPQLLPLPLIGPTPSGIAAHNTRPASSPLVFTT